MKNLKIVEKYCTYDKRKRSNYVEKELRILKVIETIVNLSRRVYPMGVASLREDQMEDLSINVRKSPCTTCASRRV